MPTRIGFFFMALLLFQGSAVAARSDCDDPRCTLKRYDLSGRCVCMEWNEEPPASRYYVNEVGDRILVIEDNVQVIYFGIDLDKITKDHNKLVISLAGAGVWLFSDAENETEGFFETLVYGEQPSTSSDYNDGIYKLAYNYLDKETVSVIGYPWFTLTGDIAINDSHWGPLPAKFAARIKEVLDKMAPNSKLVLLGKSMGACKMQQVAEELNAQGVTVDLLVLVDGSCWAAPPFNADHSSERMRIYSNVKKVYNFRQISTYPDNDKQNGFSIAYSPPTKGHDIIVSDVGNNIGNLMCEGVGHDDIDECANLLASIDRIVKAEFTPNVLSIINLLLSD